MVDTTPNPNPSLNDILKPWLEQRGFYITEILDKVNGKCDFYAKKNSRLTVVVYNNEVCGFGARAVFHPSDPQFFEKLELWISE